MPQLETYEWSNIWWEHASDINVKKWINTSSKQLRENGGYYYNTSGCLYPQYFKMKNAHGHPCASSFCISFQQPQPQSLLPQPQLPKPPQSRRMMIKITIQEEPLQPLLQPQPISCTSFPVSKPYYEKEKKVLKIFKSFCPIYNEVNEHRNIQNAPFNPYSSAIGSI